MKKNFFILIILTVISKLFGFGREIFLSYYYGANNLSDAYIISMTIPSVVLGFIVAGLSAVYIPIYSEISDSYGDDKANCFTSKLINILFVISTLLIALSVIFVNPIVKLFAIGFDQATLDIASELTTVTLFSMYFIGVVAIFSSFLQIKGDFKTPALIGLPMNAVIMVSIAFSVGKPVYVLSIGYVIAIGSQLIFMIPRIKRNGYQHRLILNNDESITKLAQNLIPVILGLSVNQINKLVDRTIASNVVTGGISALNYANVINDFIKYVFIFSIITVIYPHMSTIALSDKNKLHEIINKSLIGISLFIIPSIIGVLVFSSKIVMLMFGRGEFDTNASLLTSNALTFYAIGLLAIGFREILTRVFYSLQDTKTPMINAALGMMLNIFLNIILSKYMGLGGLALATSIAATFSFLLMFISLRRKIGPFGMKQISISFLKILFASLVMGGLAKLSFNYLTASLSQNLSLLMAIGVGAVSYFVIIYFMKIEDVDVIVGAIKKKLGRGAA